MPGTVFLHSLRTATLPINTPISQMRQPRLGKAQAFAGERGVTQLCVLELGSIQPLPSGFKLEKERRVQGRERDGDAGQKSKWGIPGKGEVSLGQELGEPKPSSAQQPGARVPGHKKAQVGRGQSLASRKQMQL